LLISSKAFGKICSGAKTLGWEHSNGSLKMISKTLEWSAICRRGETTYAMGWLKWGPN
jgi:hypothetical protein